MLTKLPLKEQAKQRYVAPFDMAEIYIGLAEKEQAQVSTERCVRFGHQRWDIENYGFNELVNEWAADHVFKHDPRAIECFLLDAFLAYNIFHAFFALNLKPQARNSKTRAFWVSLITAELYAEVVPTSLSP